MPGQYYLLRVQGYLPNRAAVLVALLTETQLSRAGSGDTEIARQQTRRLHHGSH